MRHDRAERPDRLATAMTATVNPLAVMKDASYQAWANDGEPPAPAIEPETFARLLGRLMSSAQLTAVRRIVLAGVDVYGLAVSGYDEFWFDASDTAHQLHLAWEIACERETGWKPDGAR